MVKQQKRTKKNVYDGKYGFLCFKANNNRKIIEKHMLCEVDE